MTAWGLLVGGAITLAALSTRRSPLPRPLVLVGSAAVLVVLAAGFMLGISAGEAGP